MPITRKMMFESISATLTIVTRNPYKTVKGIIRIAWIVPVERIKQAGSRAVSRDVTGRF
jgi:hypothetical protein